MKDVNDLVQTVFSGLSPLVIEDVADEGERIVVRARTPQGTAVCPVGGASSGRVHGSHLRTVAVDKWVGSTAHPDMIKAAAARGGYDLNDHRPMQVDKAALAWPDVILAMDQSVLDKLLLLGGDENAHKMQRYLDGRTRPHG
ncbi:arsenate reductase/protein-tyrosine-phosphatase family protein [Streptomyces sp. NPDC055134]